MACAALERAESRYTRLVESAEDAICTADEEGNFTSVNRALERVMGRSREALLGTHFTELVHADERGELWLMFVASLEGKYRHRSLQIRTITAIVPSSAIPGNRGDGNSGYTDGDVMDRDAGLCPLAYRRNLGLICTRMIRFRAANSPGRQGGDHGST
jgi:PAS domain-containing protein